MPGMSYQTASSGGGPEDVKVGGGGSLSAGADWARVALETWQILEAKKARKEAKREAQRARRVEGAYNVASGIADVIQQHVERMTDFRIRAMAMNAMGKASQLTPEQMWIASQ